MDNIDKVLMDCFYTVSRSRHFSNEGVPLPLSIGQIKEYLDVFRIPLESQLVVEVVMSLDDIFIENAYEQVKKKTTTTKGQKIPI